MQADSQPRRPWALATGRLCMRLTGVLVGVLVLHAGLLGVWPSLQVAPPHPANTAAQRVTAVRMLTRPLALLAPPTPPSQSRSRRASELAQRRAAAPAANATLTPAATPTAARPDLRHTLPAAITLWFRWQQGELGAPARLQWQVEDDRYLLSLETVDGAAQRPAAWLRSRGSLLAAGLAPERHTARRSPGSERALTFVREAPGPRVFFSARTEAAEVSPDTQDSVSWLPQLLAHVAAGDTQVMLPVAEVGGSVQTWWLVAEANEPWLWRRRASGPEQTEITLWLSPTPPHWPVRLRMAPAWGPALELHQATPSDGASFE